MALTLRSVVVALILGVSLSAQTNQPTLAVSLDPIEGILDAFQSHELVALCDAHGNEQSQAFLKALIRDPRFAVAVNDIVIEFASARHQTLIDRYVNGDDVSIDALRRAWKDTTIANEIPVDEEFFRVVRLVNATLAPERRLRVLAGDPPIDWSKVKDRADHSKWLAMRDSFPAALIQTEVLARQRRALVVYGHFHFQRQNLQSNLDMSDWRMQTLVSLLERSTPAKVFTIWNADDELAAVQPNVKSWSTPGLVTVKGTLIGAADASIVGPSGARFAFKEGKPAPVPRDQYRPLRLEDQLDAVLYLGPKSAMSDMPLSKSICTDPRYVEERLRRIALTGIPKFEADRVKNLCGG